MVTKYVSALGTDDYTVDGSADNVQINLALAWANSNGTVESPVTVYLRGPYTYDLVDNLLVGSNTILTGDTTAVIRLHNSAGWVLWKPLIGQITGVTPQNFTLSNITIDGNYANQPEYASNEWGDGYYPGLYFQGTLSSPVRNISVHDILIKGTLTDGVRISYGDNIDFYNNKTVECMHEGIYVLRSLNCDIYNNDFTIRTNSGSRCYNSQYVNIYNNVYRPYNLDSLAGNFGIQIEDNPASTDINTMNVNCYGNTLMNCWGGGIWCVDLTGTTTDKNIRIHDNTINGCGRITTTTYNAGICVQGFNKIQIYNNVLRNNYNAGILVANAPSSGSGYIYYVHDNVVSSTLDSLASSLGAGHGYGLVNRHPTFVTVSATNNLVTDSFVGDYYQVSNLNDVITTPIRTVPSIRINEEDEIIDYYVDGYSSYVNGYPIKVLGYEVDTDQSIGTDKPPGFNGWVLADFGADGASIALRCFGLGKDDVRRAMSAWKRSGRTYLELGGDSTGYQVSGVVRNHSSKISRDGGDIMGDMKPYFYNVNFYCDEPYESGLQTHIRARKLTYSGEQWSSDNAYAGNIVNNPNFEEWTRGTVQTWAEETPAASVEFRAVDYSPELEQFIAVASSGTGTRIQKSTGNGLWSVPSSLPANADNAWYGVTWGAVKGVTTGDPDGYYLVSSDDFYLLSLDDYYVFSNDLSPPIGVLDGRWVAIGHTAGTNGTIYSDDGDSWSAGVTPTGNFADVCYVRDDAEFIYRYIAVGNNIAIYSDDGGETWDSVSVSGSFVAVCYSESLKRLVAVASTGHMIYSDDYGETWTALNNYQVGFVTQDGNQFYTGSGDEFLVGVTSSDSWEDVIRSESLGLFIAVCSSATNKQIATSETGLSGSWVLHETPIAGSVVTPPVSGDVSTSTYTTDTAYVYYTAASTSYSGSTSLKYTKEFPVMEAGLFYRIDQVYCKLKTAKAGKIASLKVTIQAASLYSGVETTIAEWTNNTTTYVQKTKDLAIESAQNETVTLRYYLKTNDSNYGASAINLGYKRTVAQTTGGTVSYSYNQWTALTEGHEAGIIVAVAKSGTGNRVMNSTDSTVWLPGSSSSDSAFSSVCFAQNLLKFVSVSTDGHISVSDDYGVYKCPDGWDLIGTGTSRSETAQEGTLSFCVTGDGLTETKGMITQPLQFEAGVTYSLTGFVKKTGSSGSAIIDVFANNEVISSIEWTTASDFSKGQKFFKFIFAPVDAILRVYGTGTPDTNTQMFFDTVKVQKISDLDIDEMGADILTSGTVETIPDVTIEAQGILAGSVEGGETAGNKRVYTRTTDVGATASTTYAYQNFFDYTIAGKAGVKYRVDQVSAKTCVASSGGKCYSKIEVYFGNTLKGTYSFTSSTVLQNYTSHTASPNIITEKGQAVTFKHYIRSSSTSIRAYIKNPGCTVTEILDTPTVSVNAGVTIWNVEDPLTVLRLCNKIFPGIKIAINADGTGSIRYTESFADARYQKAVLSRTGDNYSETLKQVLLTGNLVWEFDSMYPMTGIPYVNLFVVSGIPKFEISLDNVQWFACDSNTSDSFTNTQITRELDNSANLRLYGATHFYMRLSPASGNLTFKAISMFSYMITIDAEHPVILNTGLANTFQVSMTNDIPCTIAMKYTDKHWMV